MSQPNTLLELIHVAPAGNTAFLLTDAGIRVTYDSLCKQVEAMADALASMGIGRGDRVATVLPNGLPAVVSFLAGSIAGTAAPLNPGYREDEFGFFLEDTNARVLLCMAEGSDAARKAAASRGVPVSYARDERQRSGYHRRRANWEDGRCTCGRRCRTGATHQWKHGPSQAGSHPASQHHGIDGEYRRAL
jgi:acyl-CoA synthetase (AMP-forming)/AMP-acid ligase II